MRICVLTEEELIRRLCSEEDETASHIIFECEMPTGDFKHDTHKPTG